MNQSELRRKLRAPRKLSFTGDGKWFVGMTLFVGAGAINTGNNLLYLLLGMMLGLIIVSGILSEQVLQKLEVTRLSGSDLFAGEESRLRFHVRNLKKVLPSYSIFVAEHESRETRARRRVAIGLPEERPTKAKDRLEEGDPGPPKALALKVSPKDGTVIVADYVFPRRGVYSYVGFDLGTRFPFGFFEKVRPFYQRSELLVYPRVRRGLDLLGRQSSAEGEASHQKQGRSDEFFGLTEFRVGDDKRDIHWKVSARRNKLIRRLFEEQDNHALAVHLFNWAPAGDAEAVEAVEGAIEITASLCAELAAGGYRFSLHTLDNTVSEGTGPGQLRSVLRHLAMLKIADDAHEPALKIASSPHRILVATGREPAQISAGFDAAIDSVARLRRVA